MDTREGTHLRTQSSETCREQTWTRGYQVWLANCPNKPQRIETPLDRRSPETRRRSKGTGAQTVTIGKDIYVSRTVNMRKKKEQTGNRNLQV